LQKVTIFGRANGTIIINALFVLGNPVGTGIVALSKKQKRPRAHKYDLIAALNIKKLGEYRLTRLNKCLILKTHIHVVTRSPVFATETR
jgi:hypothetical protein